MSRESNIVEERTTIPLHDMSRSNDPPGAPRPINTQVLYVDNRGAPATIIARTWRLNDARRCRLCARCTASIGDMGLTAMCLIRADQYVPIETAHLFRNLTSFVRTTLDGADQRPVAHA